MNTNQNDGNEKLVPVANKKVLYLTKEQFHKSAKRLAKELDSYSSYLDWKWKLAGTQELLSKSLGFKSYHEINQFYETDAPLPIETDFPATITGPFIANWSAEHVIKLFSNLIPNNSAENDIWKNRATYLLSVVVRALKYMSDQEEIILDVAALNEYLILDNIIKLYKTRRDFPSEIRHQLRNYLISLPGFQESAPKQNETVAQQHGYLQMQFSSSMHLFKMLEKADPIIINPHWFIINFSKVKLSHEYIEKAGIKTEHDMHYYSMKQVHDASPGNKVSHFSITLENDNLSDIAKNFSAEDWHRSFSEIKKGDDFAYYINEQQEYIFLQNIALRPELRFDSQIEDTWIHDSHFSNILLSLIRSKQFKAFYLSDLLLYGVKIVNREKQKIYFEFLSNLLNNYDSTVEFSQHLTNLVQ